MPYVDLEYYVEEYKGESVEETDFPSLCERAEEIIEELSMYRITPKFFSSVLPDVQEKIKRAICAQIEYLDANGGADMDNGVQVQSAGLGKFNYTKMSDVNGSGRQSVYAPRAIRILAPMGLVYRGGGYC